MDSRVRIVSDGTSHTTNVLIDGEPVDNVIAVTWSCKVDELAVATLTLEGVPVEVTGELTDPPVEAPA